ncbi:MAG TPA: CopG family antitoxin [Pyrinomonadaceae bacterium]
MRRNRSSVSKAGSYREIGEFWDNHDLSEHWDKSEAVKFEVEIEGETTYYPVETALSAKIRSIAEKRGVAPERLLNEWVQEKIGEEIVPKSD